MYFIDGSQYDGSDIVISVPPICSPTGVVIIALLYIGLAPASNATFGAFVALLYACFPFTVISQLSTGPMLEATSPPDKRGLAQGVNITVMSLGGAVSPFVLGVISDLAGTPVAIWICISISFIAACGESFCCLYLSIHAIRCKRSCAHSFLNMQFFSQYSIDLGERLQCSREAAHRGKEATEGRR